MSLGPWYAALFGMDAAAAMRPVCERMQWLGRQPVRGWCAAVLTPLRVAYGNGSACTDSDVTTC